jgi:hypothetical protein
LLFPPDNSLFINNFQVFDWSDVQGAEKYELELTYPNDEHRTFSIPQPPQPSPPEKGFKLFIDSIIDFFKTLVGSITGFAVAKVAPESQLIVSEELWNSLPYGRYIWKVKAIADSYQGSYSEEFTFYKEKPRLPVKKVKEPVKTFERTQRNPIPQILLNAYYDSDDKPEFIGNIEQLVTESNFLNKVDLRLTNTTFLQSEDYITSDNKVPVIILLNEDETLSDPSITKKREFHLINAISADISQNSLSWLSASDSVKGIYLNERVSLSEPLGSGEGATQNLDNRNELINSEYAWNLGYRGFGIKIAVLDTGVDKNHPDLEGKVIAEASFVTDEPPFDFHGHGTHVASTAAGTGKASDGDFAGVAIEASIMNGKVLNKDGGANIDWIISGIEWAVDNDADIISMSLGESDPIPGLNHPWTEAVNKAADSGVVFVIAAGNSGWY